MRSKTPDPLAQRTNLWLAMQAGNIRALRSRLPDWIRTQPALAKAVSEAFIASRSKFTAPHLQVVAELRLLERYGLCGGGGSIDPQALVQRAHFDAGVVLTHRAMHKAVGRAPEAIDSILNVGSGVSYDALAYGLTYPRAARCFGFDIDKTAVSHYREHVAEDARASLVLDGRTSAYFVHAGDLLELGTADFMRRLDGHKVLEDAGELEQFTLIAVPHPNPVEWLNRSGHAAVSAGATTAIELSLDRLASIIAGLQARLGDAGVVMFLIDRKAWIEPPAVAALVGMMVSAGFVATDVPETLFLGGRARGSQHHLAWLRNDNGDRMVVGDASALSEFAARLNNLRELGRAMGMGEAQHGNLLSLLVARRNYHPEHLSMALGLQNRQEQLRRLFAGLGDETGFQCIEAKLIRFLQSHC